MSEESPLRDEATETELASVKEAEADQEAVAVEEQEPEEPPVPAAVKQWVPLSGGACDARFGFGVLDELESMLRSVSGRPHRAALLAPSSFDEGLVERVRRELTSAGFEVARIELEAVGGVRSMNTAAQLARHLDDAGISVDDIVCAVGSTDLLSLAAFVCQSWCGGTPLVSVAGDLSTLVEAVATPRGLDVSRHEQMVTVSPWCRHIVCDFDLVSLDPSQEDVMLTRSFMVQAAMLDSVEGFTKLWDRSLEIAGGDLFALSDQLAETLKARGRTSSSTSLALRQSLRYGNELARALARLTKAPRSILLAEGLRFAARLSAGMERFEVDDVMAQDELLERLGIGYLEEDLDAEQLVRTFRDECFVRSSRLQVALPEKLGRVRLANVTDELLEAHLGGFCATRSAQ